MSFVNRWLKNLFGVSWTCPIIDGVQYEPDPVFGHGICYEKCRDGYSGVSFLCWPGCSKQGDNIYPDGWTDWGFVCHKNSFYRGNGSVADGCDIDHPVFQNGSCYKECLPGYVSDNTVPSNICAQQCPENTYASGPLTCQKNPGSEYGRGAGNQGNGCPSGYNNVGLTCVKFFPPSISGFVCPNNCTYGPKDGNDGKNGRPCSYWYGKQPGDCGPSIVNPSPDGNIFYNTVLNPRNQRQCEENNGWLCYPKCDIGYENFGCCVCTVKCTGMTNSGIFCSGRNLYNRGDPVKSENCFDPDMRNENGQCRAPCKEGFSGIGTHCTKNGCPDGCTSVLGVCVKQPYKRNSTIGTPPFASILNRKLNLGATGNLLKESFFNFGTVLGILLLSFGVYLLLSLRMKNKFK